MITTAVCYAVVVVKIIDKENVAVLIKSGIRSKKADFGDGQQEPGEIENLVGCGFVRSDPARAVQGRLSIAFSFFPKSALS